MLITITKSFEINVPKFTDELDDLVGLHQCSKNTLPFRTLL